jgi:hypothetical protein
MVPKKIRNLQGKVRTADPRQVELDAPFTAIQDRQEPTSAPSVTLANARRQLEAIMAQTGRQTEILKNGDIFFLYRPRVGEEEPESLEDVQRFFVVLRPDGGRKIRLLVVGRKRLPKAEEHERHWGFVSMVADSGAAIERELRAADYETKTRGERHEPAVRPAGEGVYAISLEDGQMHLSYALELPEKPDEVQEAFRIAPEASFALSIKNPEKGQPPGAGLAAPQKADYPDRLQREFRDRRFAREDARLLDVENAEFLLVGARTDPQREYGLDLDAEHEDYGHADVVRHLKMAKSRHPVEPLLKGSWQ